MHEDNDLLVEDLLALKQRVRESSHLASNYGRAIASVRAHPTPLRSAREAKQLKNIGNYLANKIHSILIKRGLLPVEQTVASNARLLTAVTHVEAEISTRKSALRTPERPIRDYIPAYRKQPWYVLLALQEAQAVDSDAAISSDSLLQIMLAAGYEGNRSKLRTCLTSLNGTHKVIERSDTGYYYLTDIGQRSAELCPGSLTGSSTYTATPATNTLCFTSDDISRQQILTSRVVQRCPLSSNSTYIEVEDSDVEVVSEELPEPEPERVNRSCTIPEDFVQETDSWELVLLLDHREIIERRNPRILERKLLEKNVNCEVRALGVGDVQWIARRHRIGEETQEFMMNVIVERKEVNDLSGSIIDRRFFEQKLRLATVRENCGNVRVIYLVEGSLSQITTVRTSSLNTAMGRTQVQNNFFVQQCQNADESVTFLARVYARLVANFPPNPRTAKPACSHLLSQGRYNADDFARVFCLPPRTFISFNSQFRKKSQFTVRDVFQQMLLQVPGLSAAKTVGLSAKYQNFLELESALRQRGRDSEVEHVRCGKSQRRLGSKAQRYLCELLTSSGYPEDM
ncbi:unnamed protein product [Peronospora destructor]|uniref:Crossover junction endonuclease MUS81 n=1 Tax=Peronospora destructor TaxID=86335 RepID=A0AAV0UL80_9STRA|nr:unnamed protein product [Peronospora destructor]